MHFLDTFRAPFEYPKRTRTPELFTTYSGGAPLYTFIHYLHMLIVPFQYLQYLLWTLLVPKVATGIYILIYTRDLFWAKVRVQLHLPPLRSLDLLISPGTLVLGGNGISFSRP